MINSDPTLTEKVDRLCAVKGISDITALTLIADLPELGQLTNKEISALAGVALQREREKEPMILSYQH